MISQGWINRIIVVALITGAFYLGKYTYQDEVMRDLTLGLEYAVEDATITGCDKEGCYVEINSNDEDWMKNHSYFFAHCDGECEIQDEFNTYGLKLDTDPSHLSERMACRDLTQELEKEIVQRPSNFGIPTLEQVFYSPARDSCLYVIYYQNGKQINRRLFDTQDDSETSRPIEACLDVIASSQCTDLDKKISELKQ